MSIVKALLKKALPARLVTLRKPGKGSYSHLDEEAIIKRYLDSLPVANKFCVDIAASDGITMSNTYSLYKNGWDGIAVEFDPVKFAALSGLYKTFGGVHLVRTKVIPNNVVSILKACQCPADFAFLNFDIDSYDYFVLERLLAEFRPRLLCVELNEKIPPPISFTVLYDPQHWWAGDHFFGQSIAQCSTLCKKYNYDIAELHYNNLFLLPHEINKQGALSPEEAYRIGYKDKPDRKEKFPWNADMEDLLNLSKDDGIKFLNDKFEKYKGKYTIG